jgi:hypothetical protein
MMNEYLTRNYQRWEIACPCCNDTNIRLATVEIAQQVRDDLGVPLHVPLGGGKRCLEYHQKECGDYPSAHTSGEAIDLYMRPYTIRNMFKLAKLMREVGFTRVGIYPEFGVKSVHGDTWQANPSASWVRVGKKYLYFKYLEQAIKFVEKKYL